MTISNTEHIKHKCTFSKMWACWFRVRFGCFLPSITPKPQNFLRSCLLRSQVIFLLLWLAVLAKTRHSWARSFNVIFFLPFLTRSSSIYDWFLTHQCPRTPLFFSLVHSAKEYPTMLVCKKPCTAAQDIELTQGWVWHLMDDRQKQPNVAYKAL